MTNSMMVCQKKRNQNHKDELFHDYQEKFFYFPKLLDFYDTKLNVWRPSIIWESISYGGVNIEDSFWSMLENLNVNILLPE